MTKGYYRKKELFTKKKGEMQLAKNSSDRHRDDEDTEDAEEDCNCYKKHCTLTDSN